MQIHNFSTRGCENVQHSLFNLGLETFATRKFRVSQGLGPFAKVYGAENYLFR